MTDSAIPASLTAVHLALAVFRHHRSRSAVVSPFVLPSFLFVVTPWIWPSTLTLIALFCAHAIWVFACEILAPPAPPASRPAASSAPRPATPRPATRPAPTGSAGGLITTAVLAVLDEASDIKTFRFARPQGFDFTPGQFVPVRVSIDGKPHVRCYSISSSPDACGYLEISVRRQGLVSTTLHATLRTGSQVTIGRPAGQFVYPRGDDRPLVLLAGGIGITPLLSMLRYAIAADPARPVVLLYSARREEDLAFVSELRVIAERHPHVRIGLTLSQATPESRQRRGRLDMQMIRQYVAHPPHSLFCICGPLPMIADVSQMLREAGVPESQIRSEQFDTTVAAGVLNPSAARDQSSAPAARGGHQVTFSVTGRTVQATGTLLEAAEADGVSIMSSCRSGVCQACRTRLVDGDADCRSDVLDPADRAAGFVLPCVTWAQGDCVLEA